MSNEPDLIRCLANNEIVSLIKALGVGIEESFDKLAYVMTELLL